MIIDVFSKYGFAIPLKTKIGIAVADALKIYLKSIHHQQCYGQIKGNNFIIST